MDYAPPVVIEPAQNARFTIITLHGLGADGHDFVPIARELTFTQKPNTRFVFPHASRLPVTINGGLTMPAWYDILEMQIDRRVDTAQLRNSAAYVHRLIDEELYKGVDSGHILIAGFSQGGAVALEAALTYPKPLAGLLVLSSYFATATTISYHPANQNLPILVQHGTHDGVVPEVLGRRTKQALAEQGYKVDYQTYAMAHSVCPEQIHAISMWLDKTLSTGDQFT